MKMSPHCPYEPGDRSQDWIKEEENARYFGKVEDLLKNFR